MVYLYQGLLSLAQLLLPSDILLKFKEVRIEEDNSLIRIYLDEMLMDSYKKNSDLESKVFREAVVIRDFPIRDLCKTLPHSLSFLFLSTIGSPAVYIFDF